MGTGCPGLMSGWLAGTPEGDFLRDIGLVGAKLLMFFRLFAGWRRKTPASRPCATRGDSGTSRRPAARLSVREGVFEQLASAGKEALNCADRAVFETRWKLPCLGFVAPKRSRAAERRGGARGGAPAHPRRSHRDGGTAKPQSVGWFSTIVSPIYDRRIASGGVHDSGGAVGFGEGCRLVGRKRESSVRFAAAGRAQQAPSSGRTTRAGPEDSLKTRVFRVGNGSNTEMKSLPGRLSLCLSPGIPGWSAHPRDGTPVTSNTRSREPLVRRNGHRSGCGGAIEPTCGVEVSSRRCGEG